MKIKFMQIQASMYGGLWALSQEGEIWQFNRYNEWERVQPPSYEEDNFTHMMPVPQEARAKPALPGTKSGVPL